MPNMDKLGVKIYLFDIIAKNNSLLFDQDITTRKKKLEEVMAGLHQLEGKEVISLVDYEIYDTQVEFPSKLQDFYASSKKMGFEGVMIKPLGGCNMLSEYVGDSRSVWMKYKKDETEFGGADNLDLVVMGVYNGDGKRKDVFGSFLLGVYDTGTGDIWPVTKYILFQKLP